MTTPTPSPDSSPAADGTGGTAQRATARPAPRAGILAAAGPRLAALLLGAAAIAWTATPLLHTGLAATALVIAIIAVTAGALRLAFIEIPVPEDRYWVSGWLRGWLNFLALLRTFAWEETASVALLWLEIQHPVRPWPTAALGAVLVGYLLTTHIAESGADTGPLLRRLAKPLAVGACLLALGAGFAMIPATTPGAGAANLPLLAAAAVIAATALVIPA